MKTPFRRAALSAHARTITLAAGAAFALPVLVASWALPDHRPKTSPALPGELTNSVTNFASPQGHPEWAVLRDKRQDTTPYKFGHKMHNDPEAAGMQSLLQAIKDGKSEANRAGRDTGRAIHVESASRDGKDLLVMSCTFCHEADAAGAYMRPVKFDTHCADCHTGTLGTVGASGESLKWVDKIVSSKAAQGLVRPTAIPHGTAADAAGAVDLALAAWIAEQPPQFPVKAAAPTGAEGEKKAEEAKPAEDAGGGRRRRPAGGGDAPKPEEAKSGEGAAAAAPPTEGGGGGRRRAGSTPAAESAKPLASAKLPGFADQAALGAWMAGQRKQIIAGKVVDACGKCHQGITPGPEAQPEAFKISDQKIPQVWLTRSHFSHAYHAMVSCVSCHAQAPGSTDTKDVMLPGVASCRECHAPNATPSGSAAPFDCVLCHTYHERLPQSVQGRMTIDQMRRGGRVVIPASEAPKAPAPAGPK